MEFSVSREDLVNYNNLLEEGDLDRYRICLGWRVKLWLIWFFKIMYEVLVEIVFFFCC